MSRMPTAKNVGEPCAGEPHARFEVAAGGNQNSRASTRRAVQAPLADPTEAGPRWYIRGELAPRDRQRAGRSKILLCAIDEEGASLLDDALNRVARSARTRAR
jgi:hypothetical protein